MRNFGFLLIEFKVLIISEFAIELGFCFLCSGFCWKCVLVVDGVLTIFTFQKHSLICTGILLMEKLWAGQSPQGLGL